MTLEDLIQQFSPQVADAFRRAIENIKSAVVLKVIVDRLERGDVQGAIDAIQIDTDAFAPLELALRDAFNSGGINMVQSLPSLINADGTRVVFQFGVRNLAAEQLIRTQSATLVTNINDDQRVGLRMGFEAGLSAGRNPTSTALDVIGRVNRVTGRREGGIIGLNSPQIAFINHARANLLSGDPDLMQKYLDLGTRDKRFDRTVTAAIREGKPVPNDMVTKIIGRLNDKNLQLRGETIGLEETRTALFSVRHNAIKQQIDAGKVDSSNVTKAWKHTSSEHPRIQHIEMVAQDAVPIDTPFIAPDGTLLMHPHDPSAPARHRIGCKCRDEYTIDYVAAGLRRYRARTAN